MWSVVHRVHWCISYDNQFTSLQVCMTHPAVVFDNVYVCLHSVQFVNEQVIQFVFLHSICFVQLRLLLRVYPVLQLRHIVDEQVAQLSEQVVAVLCLNSSSSGVFFI